MFSLQQADENAALQNCQSKLKKLTDENIDLSKMKFFELRELNSHLEKVIQFQQKEIKNSFVNEMNEMKIGIEELVAHKKLQEMITLRDNNILGLQKSFQFLGAMSCQLGNEKLQEVALLGMAATEIISGGLQLMGTAGAQLMAAVPGLAAMGPIGVAAQGVLTLFNLFSKKKGQRQPDPFAMAMMKNLQIISDQIANMHAELREMRVEMHELFDKNFQAQQIIYKAICDGIHYLGEEVRDNHFTVMNTLERIDRDVRVLDEKVHSHSLHPLRVILTKVSALCAGTLKVDLHKRVESAAVNLMAWLQPEHGIAALDMYNGAIYFHQTDSKSLLHVVAERLKTPFLDTTFEHFGLLTYYAASIGHRFSVEKESKLPKTVTVPAPFNLKLWSSAAESYYDLKDKFREWLPDIDLNRIEAAANNQKMIAQSLRSYELFEKLFVQYENVLSEILNTVKAALKKQSASFNDNIVRFQPKHPSDKHISLRRYTCHFDISKSIVPFLIGKEWKDCLPVIKSVSTYQFDNHPAHIPALFVLAERLNLLSFVRELKFQSGILRIGISTTLNRSLEIHHFVYPASELGTFTTLIASDQHTPTVEAALKIATQHILSCFDNQRRQALGVLFHSQEFTSTLQKLEAYRNLIIHFANACCFKEKALLQNFLWDGQKIKDELEICVTKMTKAEQKPNGTIQNPSFIELFQEELHVSSSLVRTCLNKLRENKPENFEASYLGYIALMMLKLKGLQYQKTTIESKPEEKQEEKKPLVSDRKIEISIPTDFKENLKNIVDSFKNYFDYLSHDAKEILTMKTHLETINKAISTFETMLTTSTDSDFLTGSKAIKNLERSFGVLDTQLKRSKKTEYTYGDRIVLLIKELTDLISILGQDKKPEIKPKSLTPSISQSSSSRSLSIFSENKFEQLQKVANSYGYEVKEMKRDGNCFYSAMTDQMNGKYTSEKLREIAVEHVKTNKTFYLDTIPDDFDFDNITAIPDKFARFISKISKPGAWAENIIPFALARALNVNIVIINSDQSDPIIIKQSTATQTFYLGYEVGSHYNSLKPVARLEFKPEKNLEQLIRTASYDGFFQNQRALSDIITR